MTKEDMKFTRKQVDRIIADASERQDRDKNSGLEPGEGLTYSQVVEVAKDSGIEPKYLQRSAKDLVAEAGGLEKAAMKNALKTISLKALDIFIGVPFIISASYFATPTITRLADEPGEDGKETPEEDRATLPYWISGLGLIAESYSAFGRDSKIGLTLLGTHVATNLVSGLYELYRHEKNKLVEEMNGKVENKKND